MLNMGVDGGSILETKRYPMAILIHEMEARNVVEEAS